MAEPGFWDSKEASQQATQELETLKKQIEPLAELMSEVQQFSELVDISDDDTMISELESKHVELEKAVQKMSKNGLNIGKYDNSNAVLMIASGAGGVDAQDWAEMLLRMYLRFAEKKHLKTNIIAMSKGTEAGIKSVSVEIKGKGAFRTLREEAGVHRLVRLSPFNANNLRQTSFAQVEVIPEIHKEEVKIEEKDLRIDTYRSSGAGGQHVNTTDSAIRITHIPTNIVVTCQNERSQLQNKEKAMNILMGKLYLLHEAQMEEEKRKARGEHKTAAWGNQIRSYVLHPYKMAKDHRSGLKTANVEQILDGDLDTFIDQ